jgi:hypothetical protein
MSTRACYRFIPENGPNDWPGVVTVYKHHDGYPFGAAKAIEAALDYAWQLPRFEADEFAAAFVAANKRSVSSLRREYEQAAADAEKKAKVDMEYAKADMPGYYRRLAKDAGNYAGGGIRLIPFEGPDAYQRFASDIAYLYDIRCENGKLRIRAYTTSERNDVWTFEQFFEGSLKQLARRKP